ncbi:HNH endonuclease signature motif containing protein [Mycobacterium sp. PSTR-4-N]|uniref:HNH endonuclease signature motif containing protein n=1 Tax=Mycobacterium sp. PSTR-4-N TaxID=2917745 RepID=UPI001F15406E|nr:HNH endonuclease signature motif containing protein [Mycobacterium sp. PSTR-4-N]MCG7594682.1 HNH endonuclease [Mycobacterium sp. PSTR-4-N]
MFEESDLTALSAADLIDAARQWARDENAAAARKMAVMAELFTRRTGVDAEDRSGWWLDPEAAVAAEVAVAVGVTQGLALHQTQRAVALRDRLPRVAALFADGLITDLLIRKIVYRTGLVTDPAVMAEVDAVIADRVGRWGQLSEKKLEQAIDATVLAHDPIAVRQVVESATERRVEFGSPSDAPGFTSVWALLPAADATALQDRLEAIAHTVCAADPRSLQNRRADALNAVGAGLDALVCQCGLEDCDAASGPTPSRNTTVFVIADSETVKDTATPAPARTNKPALLFGSGVTPVEALNLTRARLRQIVHPGDSLPEGRYTPSRALAEFVRCRDVTCRFPGCDVPATEADIDHTVPYPVGPTHASNLKALCRFHHLLKTFWDGPEGWRDRQLPDGTVIWTSPTGHEYTTYPGSRDLFPSLCRPTGTLWDDDPPRPAACVARGAMMPRRRHTRAQNRARAVTAARRLNQQHGAEPHGPPPF